MRFSVYAIRLRKDVMKKSGFANANPDHDPSKSCLYVGSTAKTPEQRYEDHLHKPTGNRWVKEFHIGLSKRYTDQKPKYANRMEAEFAEFVHAMRLRKKGHAVWTNLPQVPAFYKQTHFSVGEWHGAPENFAIITAYATTGETWSDKANAVADRKLKNTLRYKSDWLVRITGYSPASGHSEPGWAAELEFQDACDIGKHFKQDAIYFGKKGKLYVSYCDERRAMVPIGRFLERLHIGQPQLLQQRFCE